MLGARGQPVPLRLRIAGVDAAPGEFPPQYGTGVDFVWATPAFYRQYRSELYDIATTALRLRGGPADMATVQQDVSRLARGKPVDDYPFSTQAVNTEHSIHLQAVVLWLVAALLSVVGVLVIGQLLARLSYLESADYPALRGVGMSRRQLLAAALGRTLVIGWDRSGRGHAGRDRAVPAVPGRPGGHRERTRRERHGSCSGWGWSPCRASRWPARPGGVARAPVPRRRARRAAGSAAGARHRRIRDDGSGWRARRGPDALRCADDRRGRRGGGRADRRWSSPEPGPPAASPALYA